jgi:hypothetical protein
MHCLSNWNEMRILFKGPSTEGLIFVFYDNIFHIIASLLPHGIVAYNNSCTVFVSIKSIYRRKTGAICRLK